MKKTFIIFLTLLLFAFISANKGSPSSETEAVITLSDFSNPHIYRNIIQEFSKIKGVSFCETSLKTMTMILQFDDSAFGLEDIKNVFNKWGCAFCTISFNPISQNLE